MEHKQGNRYYRKFKNKGRFRKPERPEEYYFTPNARRQNVELLYSKKKALRVLLKNVRFLTSRAAPKLHRPPNWYYITLQQMPGAPPIKLHTKPKIASAL